MLLAAINADLPADQHVDARALSKPLRDIGMVRYSPAFKWRGKTRSVWIVGGVEATNKAVRDALNETMI